MTNFEERLNDILREKNVKSASFSFGKGSIFTCELVNVSNDEEFKATDYTMENALNKAYELYQEDERQARDHSL